MAKIRPSVNDSFYMISQMEYVLGTRQYYIGQVFNPQVVDSRPQGEGIIIFKSVKMINSLL